MKLSTRTRYGIRAMLEIALHDGVKPVDLNEISHNQGISKKYLHTLLVSLKNRGLLNSVRGNTGGYLLAKKPGEINLFEIYTTLEGPTGLVDCIANPAACGRSETCATRKLWGRLSAAIRRELEGTTLADLVQDNAGKCELLNYDI